MTYVLGIDLGTTYSAAATARDGRPSICELGTRAATIPSVVALGEDGELITGEAAERRALAAPARVAREFKRRLGDPSPLVLGATPFGAETLMAELFRAMVEQVQTREGEPPALVTVTHPASFGEYRHDLLEKAIRLVHDGPVVLVSEPEAAAVHYASLERVDPGEVIAVYDLGGGTFDVAVLRKTETGFETLGEPQGIDRLGGADFDEAVYTVVSQALEGQLSNITPASAAERSALLRLREECRLAKEALSSDTATTLPVLLPGLTTEVRLTRAEFEDAIRPRIRETLNVLDRAVRTTGLEMDDVSRILLVGGSSRIPLVAEEVSRHTGRPVAVDTHPKHAIALGAALIAWQRISDHAAEPAPAAAPSSVASESATAPVAEPVSEPAASIAPPPPGDRVRPSPGGRGSEPPPPSGRPRWLFPVGGLAVLGVAALGGFFLFGGGDDEPDNAAADDPAAPSQTATATVSVAAGADTETAEPTETATPTATPTSEPTATPTPEGPRVAITGITIDGAQYNVFFEPTGFTPVLPGQHVHFFFDTVPPEQAGVPGTGPWVLYGGPSPFTELGPADRPPGATQMCILVANPDHSVQLGTGNCFDLP